MRLFTDERFFLTEGQNCEQWASHRIASHRMDGNQRIFGGGGFSREFGIKSHDPLFLSFYNVM